MAIYHVSRQQLTLILRSKWLTSFGILFTVLAVMVAYFGHSGHSGFEGFNRMTASLLNLNLMLIPLISLLIGSLFLAGEKEDRGLTLMLTYPLHPRTILIGKYIGLFVAVWSVLTFAYGAAVLVMYLINSTASITSLLLFYLFSILLAAVFLSLSMLIGISSKTRFQALGVSLIVWAFAVLFYEFIVMGLSLIAAKQLILPMFTVSIFLNPVELIRVWAILSMDGAAVFGPKLYDLTIWANGLIGQLLFVLSVIFWFVTPILLSSFLLNRGISDE
ncbi:ABC transporter permease [Bacillus aquiflavi]|uniref:ABC transporter permease n=1 Tax=Bacillus aquiflavi TaxID=2672567 RepID=A0A6B3VXR6_9BACI|nr:ABC transporter permease [Bacillus aquiflavi]MBA4536730.1 ABC transporter permease [Bacillus aquiflavi]NEY81097.1 ABC transporter permease [Bacillus aquiflavi]UAC48761.1 ABC transporter permease [Bacillus aquiflavi]